MAAGKRWRAVGAHSRGHRGGRGRRRYPWRRAAGVRPYPPSAAA